MNYHFDPRYQELTRYDVMLDAEVVKFMAVTEYGTFHMEHPATGAALRDLRKQFKDHVVHLMDNGVEPCQVDLDNVWSQAHG